MTSNVQIRDGAGWADLRIEVLQGPGKRFARPFGASATSKEANRARTA